MGKRMTHKVAILARALAIGWAAVAVLAYQSEAVSLSDKVVGQLKAEGKLQAYVERMQALRQEGLDQPARKVAGTDLACGPAVVNDKLPVILIDFYDKVSTSGYVAATPARFDSLLFSTGKNPTGSMKEYYLENSYGSYIPDGRTFGWYQAIWNLSSYNGIPEESDYAELTPRQLVIEAIQKAQGDINFHEFDADHDGIIRGIIIIHAGTGYEESGDLVEIHSHTSPLYYTTDDTVLIESYTIQPEESAISQSMSAIGVFCHEWGHVLGLPDLYDTDYSSAGVGRWSLMGSGNYNGYSKRPAHMDAWSKIQLSWLSSTNITANISGVSIPALEFNPAAYRMNKNGSSSTAQYWLIENRHRIGFDDELPGEGLLIYHIDDNSPGNYVDWDPLVFVEAADGKFDLQYRRNQGDDVDPFPAGGVARQFHDKTIPDSRYYNGQSSQVGVWNISDPDSVMTADLDVTFSRPWLESENILFSDLAYGDNDGKLEAGERIQVFLTMSNDWATAADISVTLSSDDSTLTVTVPQASYGSLGTGQTGNNNAAPFVFLIPAVLTSRIDSFFFSVTANGGAYQAVFGAEAFIGVPRILIVDDDNGDPDHYENSLGMLLYTLRVPVSTWPKNLSGSPDSATLAMYHNVLWLTGDYRLNTLSAADLTAMKGFLNGGGNLFLTGQGIAKQLSTQNPAFLSNYLKASYVDSVYRLIPVLQGTSGPVSSGLAMMAINNNGGARNQTVYDHLLPINGGIAEWKFYTCNNYGAVSYSGDYKTVFFDFGFESIINGDPQFASRDTVLARIMAFFGDLPTDVEAPDGMAVNLPDKIRLSQNCPNPFNPSTRITYLVAGQAGSRTDRTLLEVFNILGQRVARLVDRDEVPGEYVVTWDGRDEQGGTAASGIYFYRLTRGGQSETRKMILLK